jgi:hypothetical protein
MIGRRGGRLTRRSRIARARARFCACGSCWGRSSRFKREGLGIWDEKQQGRKAFGPGLWGKRVAEPPESGVRSFGVKFTPDGSHVAIAGAMKAPDGTGARRGDPSGSDV